jgi:hypothetical protein
MGCLTTISSQLKIILFFSETKLKIILLFLIFFSEINIAHFNGFNETGGFLPLLLKKIAHFLNQNLSSAYEVSSYSNELVKVHI